MSRRALLLLNLKGNFSRLYLRPSPPNRISLSPSFSPIIRKFFSSKQNLNLLETNPTAIRLPEDDASSGVDDISTEELKKRIGKYLEGDMEVLPSIFEAILQRKLSGKHNDTDDELMEELRSKMPCTTEFEEEYDLTSDDDFDMSDEDGDSSSE